MKKLVTLIGTLALASTLGLAGCKKKEEAKTEPATEATKPAEPAAATPPATEPAAATPAAPAAPAGDMPAECADYKAAMEKLAACDKLPAEAKDAAKTAWTAWETGFASAPAEAKAAAGTACKAAADGVKASLTAAGC